MQSTKLSKTQNHCVLFHDHKMAWTQPQPDLPRCASTDTIGRCKPALWQLTPAVVLRAVVSEAKTILTQKIGRSTPLPRFFTINSRNLAKHFPLESRPAVTDNVGVSFLFPYQGMHMPGGEALARSQIPEEHLGCSPVRILSRQPESRGLQTHPRLQRRRAL